jgi:hypothetical protein
LELKAVTSIPCGAVGARNSVLGCETNIENVGLSVAIVAVQTLVREAELGQSDGCLARGPETVGVAPDAVELTVARKMMCLYNVQMEGIRPQAYHLIVADNSHHTQRLKAAALGVIRLRSKDNIGVKVGVQVRDAVARNGVFESGLALTTGVIGAVSSGVVGAIAVNIHVVILALTLEKNGIGNVTTVTGSSVKDIG